MRFGMERTTGRLALFLTLEEAEELLERALMSPGENTPALRSALRALMEALSDDAPAQKAA